MGIPYATFFQLFYMLVIFYLKCLEKKNFKQYIQSGNIEIKTLIPLSILVK